MLFAALFIAQALLFSVAAIQPARTVACAHTNAVVMLVLVTYAVVGYPLVAHLVGQRYPAMPTFGLPCPTTILTIGVLTWTAADRAWWLWVVLFVRSRFSGER